jgi:hypothetical protein
VTTLPPASQSISSVAVPTSGAVEGDAASCAAETSGPARDLPR